MALPRAVLAALAATLAAAASEGQCGQSGVHCVGDDVQSLLQLQLNPHSPQALLASERLPFGVLPFDEKLEPASVLQVTESRTARRPIQWLHIHKAGGTFMCEMGRRAGERMVQPNLNCNWHGHDMFFDSGHPELGPTCEQRKAHFQQGGFTWGHIERELWDQDLCHDFFDYGVMVREPMALMQSIINFQPNLNLQFLSMVKDAVAKQEKPGPCMDTERGEGERWKIMDNFQVRLLARATDVTAGHINATHLEKAKKFLQDNFKYVQRLEDLPHNGAVLFKSLTWPESMTAYLNEHTNDAPERWNFTPEDSAWLKELNKYDTALWESLR